MPMNNFVTRVNNYLLERDAVVWNSKLVWILPIACGIHLLFFLTGYFSLSIRGALADSSIAYNIAGSQVYMFSILISILIIVLWLIQLFKNNAFKSFYPASKFQLFGSFLLYFLIIFACSGFHISYVLGREAYVKHTFPESRMQRELDESNLAATFLLYNGNDYTLDNKSYPAPFDTLFCETNYRTDANFPLVKDSFGAYQFYTFSKDSIPLKIFENMKYDIRGVIVSYRDDSSYVYYKKDKVVDLRAMVSPALSLYNYSTLRFDDGSKREYMRVSSYGYNNYDKSIHSFDESRKIRFAQNKKVYALLERNNPAEIKKLMSDFLDIANYYGVANNLTVKAWLQLVNVRDGFKVSHLMSNNGYDSSNNEIGIRNAQAAVDSAVATVAVTGNAVLADTNKYANRKLPVTKLYFADDQLNNVFTNVSEIRSYSIFTNMFYTTFWITFFFASVLFAFRVTGMKELLFAIITTAIITIVIGIIVIGVRGDDELFIFYLIFATMVFIFLMSTVFRNKLRKRMASIFLNISIVIIVPFFLLILGIISMHQDKMNREISLHLKNYTPPPVLLERLGEHTHWVLFFTGLICLYWYTAVIRNWKSLPDR